MNARFIDCSHEDDKQSRMPRVASASLRILLILAISMLHLSSGKEVSAQSRLLLTVLYDNYPYKKGLIASNGFSCIIRGAEKTVLFDTGAEADVLLYNMKMLNIDPKKIDSIVISHDHGDHTGGLLSILERNNKVTVFIPDGFSDHSLTQKISAYGARWIIVKQPTLICRNVLSTGPLQGHGLYEQSLIVNSKYGLILISGCAHPGISNIIEKNITIFKKPTLFVFGGFHLKSASNEKINEVLRKFVFYGVKAVGGSHCTAARALQLFKATYGKNYKRMGVGKTIALR